MSSTVTEPQGSVFGSGDAADSVALGIRGLCKTYDNGNVALRDVSLTVPQGSFFALLGPNGAGKSTLINALADIVRPTSGEARLFGHDMFHDKAWCKRRMGVVP
ncbi:MAG: ATP-binding cassette domain-containing protein, partial [Mariprofundaceae bacterium]